MSVYDYSLLNQQGEEVSLKKYEGKVLLIVNTATECGFTPQYEALQELYTKYHIQGFEILDVPCNQFGQQAPGSDAQLHEFCTLKYNTTFPQFHKSVVNGEGELELYRYLKSQKGFEGFGESEKSGILNELLQSTHPDYLETSDIKWNFTKFLIDREGEVVARFEPTCSLEEVEKAIQALF